MLALWADAGDIFALFIDGKAAALVSTGILDGGYPALSPAHPSAAWFERMVRDLWGYVAIGGTDAALARPRALAADHAAGTARLGAPRAVRRDARSSPSTKRFDQLPIGPVRGGIELAAHLRLAIDGEAVVRLEPLLGYSHKGTLALMRGKSPRAAARFAARIAGEERLPD